MKENIVLEITNKDDDKAYAKTKEIAADSEMSNKYYKYIDCFASLLEDEKSYIRTRAFILICCQAKWDNEDKIEKNLSKMFKLLHDEKPTVIRQSLKAIKEVIVYKPNLVNRIKNEINNIDTSLYKETMAHLINKDINEIMKLIEENE